MEPKLLTISETTFLNRYAEEIKNLQMKEDETKSEKKVFTKIPLDYAIIYKMYCLPILFHPLSVGYCLKYKKPSWEKVLKTLEVIIEYEILNESYLKKDELDIAIFHYRNLQNILK